MMVPVLVAALLAGEGYRDILRFDANLPASNRVQRLGGSAATLDQLLRMLEVPVDSQTLVFSKTSFAAPHVSPRTPRAIYFNDDTYVAWTPGRAEIATVDSNYGMAFYTLVLDGGSKFEQSRHCLNCHHGPATEGVPGVFVGSVLPNQLGVPAHGEASIITSPATEWRERWGGWYVDHVPTAFEDRSNSWATDPEEPRRLSRMIAPAYNPSQYLRPTSDLVALLMLEHQTQATNLLTRLGREFALQTNHAHTLRDTVRALTFRDERPLAAPIPIRNFNPATAPLRALDLKTRVFRYPVSYLVATPVFLRLPAPLRHEIYGELATTRSSGMDEALDHLAEASADFRAWRAKQK